MTLEIPIDIDLSQLDFSDLEAKFKVQEEDPLESVIIIDNTPAVDSSKKDKLLVVLKKKFKEAGCAEIKEIHFAEEDGKLKGFIFVQFENPSEAKEAQTKMNGFAFDKNHTFSVIRFNEFQDILNVKDEICLPPKEECKETDNLLSWLEDGRDQLVTLASDEVAVLWNNGALPPDVVYKKSNWTDSTIQWSINGTYLCTFHKQGIAFWGGSSWQRIQRFVHSNVSLVDFSPNEQYLITWSSTNASGVSGKEENLRIWDLTTGKLLRGFATPEIKTKEDLDKWPFFKWSPDETYVARLAKDAISVYTLPSLTLIDNKAIKIESVQDFCWSPKENLIAYWTPELSNTPARVSLISIPSRQLIRSKNLVMVSDCTLKFDSNEGDFLCVGIERYAKGKKSKFSCLEMFFLREKDVPIDSFEEFKDRKVLSISWEPKGDRLSVLSILPDNGKAFVTFLKADKNSFKELKTIEKKSLTDMFWSPTGRFIVLANLKNQGELEFFDVDEMATMNTGEHMQVTNVEWDPSGRYVMSSSSFLKNQGENSVVLWDFKGKFLFKKSLLKLKYSFWRPRPPSLLSKDQMKSIRKNLKNFSEEFDQLDSQKSGVVKQKIQAQKSEVLSSWKKWLAQKQKLHLEEREQRAKIRGTEENPIYSDQEDEDEDIEEMIEEIIEEHEEIVPNE